jgi:hypothetical protein
MVVERSTSRLGRFTPLKNLGGAHWSLSGLQGRLDILEKRNIINNSAGIRTLDSAARVMATILTDLSRLFLFLARFISTFNCIQLADTERLVKNQTRDITVEC